MNNEESSLLVPEVVRRETNNLQARDLDAAISAATTRLEEAAILNGQPVLPQPLSISRSSYDVLELLKGQVDSLVRIGYDAIPQSAILERALQKRRPFQENGAGYRDTVIWLALLNGLSHDISAEPVAFIAKNKADLF